MEVKAKSSMLLVFGLGAFFLFIFLGSTLPAFQEYRSIRKERDRLLNENAALQKELFENRREQEELKNSYFYNERLRRLLYQSGPQSTPK